MFVRMCHTVKVMERFTGLKFQGFCGFEEYRTSLSMNVYLYIQTLYNGVVF